MTPEFMAINPFHQIPAIQEGDFNLGETNGLSCYVTMTMSTN